MGDDPRERERAKAIAELARKVAAGAIPRKPGEAVAEAVLRVLVKRGTRPAKGPGHRQV